MNFALVCITLVVAIAIFIAGTLYGKKLALDMLKTADAIEDRLRNLIG